MAIVQCSIGYSFKLQGHGGPRRQTRNEFKFWISYYFNIWHILRLATLNLVDKGGDDAPYPKQIMTLKVCNFTHNLLSLAASGVIQDPMTPDFKT